MSPQTRTRAPYVVWALTRGLVVLLLVLGLTRTEGDATYYASQLSGVGPFGLESALREYPTPAALLLLVVKGVAHLVGVELLVALIAACLVFDVAMTVALTRRRDRFALWAWVVGLALAGPVAFSRFDLVPGVLTGLALLVALGRPRLSGAMAAVATGLKIWPVVTVLPLLARTARRRAMLTAFVVTGLVVLAVSVVCGGVSRLFSPLSFQADRGLQIESIAATPLMLARAFDPSRWAVSYSLTYHSSQVSGPGTTLMLAFSSAVTVLWLVGTALVFLNLRLWESPRRMLTLDRGLWALLAAVAGFMASSKVLSPQYFLWLLPAGVAAITLSRDPRVRRWLLTLVVACALTTLVYPVLYDGASRTSEAVLMWPATLCLVARNLLLTALTLVAYRQALAGLLPLLRRLAHGSWRDPEEPEQPVSAATRDRAGETLG